MQFHLPFHFKFIVQFFWFKDISLLRFYSDSVYESNNSAVRCASHSLFDGLMPLLPFALSCHLSLITIFHCLLYFYLFKMVKNMAFGCSPSIYLLFVLFLLILRSELVFIQGSLSLHPHTPVTPCWRSARLPLHHLARQVCYLALSAHSIEVVHRNTINQHVRGQNIGETLKIVKQMLIKL